MKRVVSLVCFGLSGVGDARQLRSNSFEAQPGAALVPPPTSATAQVRIDVMASARTQLASDHKSLRDVTSQLLQVQSAVDQTEKDLFGKVVDTQTIRQLYGSHQEVSGKNMRSEDEITVLDGKVESLSTDLGMAQRALALGGRTERAQEMALNGKISEDKVLIQNLTEELTAYQKRDLPGSHSRLASEHGQLLAASHAAQQVVAQVTGDLGTTKKEKDAEIAKTSQLKTYLVEVHHFSTQCHDRVKTLEKDVRVAAAVEPRETAGLEAAKHQAHATAQATEQRLLSEGALLKAAIRKIELQAHGEIGTLHHALGDSDTLQASIVSEVSRLEQKIAQAKAQIQSLTVSLQENIATEGEDLGQESMLKKELTKLDNQVSPVEYAALTGENNALQMELDRVAALLSESKMNEAKAVVTADQAKAQSAAQQQTQELAEQSMKEAREEGARQLKEAVAKMKESKDKSERLGEKAEGSIAARCRVDWKERKEQTDKDLKECDRTKDELMVTKAQQETLKQTLVAQSAD